MIIKDRIYGEVEIKEQVLIDLINSKIMQRLKGIAQYGIPDKYNHMKNGFSRYEHSVGVMILLRRLNANIKEQIAGLLHDVSHTAFSHVIDHVIGDPTKEDFQDSNHLNIVENSEIPGILNKYGFDYKEISDLERFHLLENHAPDICADRIDYTLRELINSLDMKMVNTLINSLIVVKNKIIFNSFKMAELFVFNYLKFQFEKWSSEETRARYHLLASALKIALEKKIITIQDFYKTDDEVIDMLIKSKDNKILRVLSVLENGFEITFGKSKNSIILKKKFRYVYPEFLSEKKLIRVSEVSNKYKEELEKQRENSLQLREVNLIY